MSGELKVTSDFKDKFFAKTTKAENGCVVWCGESHNIRFDESVFLTPRRAAYLIKYQKMPTHEIKLKCLTQNCVAWQHFLEGRESKSGRKNQLSEGDIAKIRDGFAEGKSKSALAREFGVSVGTIFNHTK